MGQDGGESAGGNRPPLEYRPTGLYSPQGRQECLPYLQARMPVATYRLGSRRGRAKINPSTSNEFKTLQKKIYSRSAVTDSGLRQI